MEDMQTILENIDNKLDMIMEHLGCSSKNKKVSADEYKNMSSEDKDKADAKDVLEGK